MKKYEILKDDSIWIDKQELFRIRAVKDIYDGNFCIVKKGFLGGYIASEYNLSHVGSCWIHENGKVLDDSQVKHDAEIIDGILCKSSTLKDRAMISYGAVISNMALIGNSATVSYAHVRGGYILGSITIKKEILIEPNNLVFTQQHEIDDYIKNYGKMIGKSGILPMNNSVEKAEVCEHKNKYKNFISNQLKFWYCPDCKKDLGDIHE